MKIYSWNVNGIRAVSKKEDFEKFINDYDPDILCIQETKAQEDQLDENILKINGYETYIMSAEKKGYSGVLVYTKKIPNNVKNFDNEEFDNEGRYIELEYKDFVLINCYFPNSQKEGKRLDYKLKFNNAVEKRIQEIEKSGKGVVLCGDLNVAHKEIDLKNPKTNTKNPGFLPEERNWMDKFLKSRMIDTFRYIHGDEIKYSWWSYRFKARDKNIGWRIDYFLITKNLENTLIDADILNQVYGSDHCPVYINIDIN